MAIPDRIQQDLTKAMKAKDALRTGALRMAKSALQNREIEKRAPLDDAEAGKVLQTLVKQREESAAQFRAAGRAELADKEDAEGAVLKAYLPAEAGEAEIARAVEQAVAETGAAGPKDIGKVMNTYNPDPTEPDNE